MQREIRSRWLMFALVALVLVGCKQKSKEEADPVVAPSASAAPAETAPPAPSPAETIAPPTQPPTAPAAAVASKGESMKTCCAALHKEESTAAPAQKSLYQTTAASCDAISKLVTVGTTKKSAALATLRAGLKGGKLPAGCE